MVSIAQVEAFEARQAELDPMIRWPRRTTLRLGWAGGFGEISLHMQGDGGMCHRDAAQFLLRAVEGDSWKAGARWSKALGQIVTDARSWPRARELVKTQLQAGDAGFDTQEQASLTVTRALDFLRRAAIVQQTVGTRRAGRWMRARIRTSAARVFLAGFWPRHGIAYVSLCENKKVVRCGCL